MANLDFPMGFRARYRIGGGVLIPVYFDLDGSQGEIAPDDLLERRSSGGIYPAQAGSTTIVGTAAEAKAASATGRIAVYASPDIVFEAQVADATVNALTDFDLNYNIVATAPVGGKSQMEIDGTTQAATATLPIKIIGYNRYPDAYANDLGAFVKVLCVINQGILKAGALG